MVDHHRQQLTLKTRTSDRIVDETDQRASVSWELDARVSSRKVQPERWTVVHQFVAHFHHHPRAFLLQVPSNNRNQNALDVLHLLNQQLLTETHRQLQTVGKFGVSLTDGLHFFLTSLEPLDCLVVRIEQHGH